MLNVINSSKINNLNLFKNFQGRRKKFKDNKMFFKNLGHTRFDSKFKDNSWRSRTSGNLSATPGVFPLVLVFLHFI